MSDRTWQCHGLTIESREEGQVVIAPETHLFCGYVFYTSDREFITRNIAYMIKHPNPLDRWIFA